MIAEFRQARLKGIEVVAEDDVGAGANAIQERGADIETKIIHIAEHRHHGRDTAAGGEQNHVSVDHRIHTELAEGSGGFEGQSDRCAVVQKNGNAAVGYTLRCDLYVASAGRRGTDGIAALFAFSIEQQLESEELARAGIEPTTQHPESERFCVSRLGSDLD